MIPFCCVRDFDISYTVFNKNSCGIEDTVIVNDNMTFKGGYSNIIFIENYSPESNIYFNSGIVKTQSSQTGIVTFWCSLFLFFWSLSVENRNYITKNKFSMLLFFQTAIYSFLSFICFKNVSLKGFYIKEGFNFEKNTFAAGISLIGSMLFGAMMVAVLAIHFQED